jgi:hypothetical protein
MVEEKQTAISPLFIVCVPTQISHKNILSQEVEAMVEQYLFSNDVGPIVIRIDRQCDVVNRFGFCHSSIPVGISFYVIRIHKKSVVKK